jgi:hypothetical protein
MSEKAIYPEGIAVFNPHEKAPEFVVGSLVITPNDLVSWLKSNPDYLTEYKGKKQLKLQIKKGTKGLYATVDTYKPKNADSLPF